MESDRFILNSIVMHCLNKHCLQIHMQKC